MTKNLPFMLLACALTLISLKASAQCNIPSSSSSSGFAVGFWNATDLPKAYDGDPSTSATLSIFSTVVGTVTATYNWSTLQQATDSVSFDMMLGFQISPSIGGVTFQAYNGSTAVGAAYNLTTFIFTANQVSHAAYVPGAPFNSVKITLTNFSFVSVQSAYLYTLFSSPRVPVIATSATPATQCITGTAGSVALKTTLDASYSDVNSSSSYFWYKSASDTSGTANAISGANASTYSPSLPNGTYTYYVKVKRSNCASTISKAYPVTFSIWNYPTLSPVNGTVLPGASRNVNYAGPTISTNYGTLSAYTQSPTGAGFTIPTGGVSGQLTASPVNAAVTANTLQETITVTANNHGCATTNTYYVPLAWVLPVTYQNPLSAFVSNDNSVKLAWTTAQEINNAYFEVQRSSDGTTFYSIATVNSKAINGNSTTPVDYTYRDSLPLSGNNYYRLNQFDLDGTSKLSTIASAYLSPSTLLTSQLYPNPATSYVILTNGLVGSNYKIVNAEGQIVLTGAIASTTQNIAVDHLSSGVYFVQFNDTKNIVKTLKFLKK
ncbi:MULTISPECIES: T9SS type A sorting domain-containing protein [Chitinophagaceae]